MESEAFTFIVAHTLSEIDKNVELDAMQRTYMRDGLLMMLTTVEDEVLAGDSDYEYR